MNTAIEKLTPGFQRYLKDQGYSVPDIGRDITEKDPIPVLRRITGLPNGAIIEGLFNEQRDVIAPRIKGALAGIVQPWRETETDEALPSITVRELSRITKLSPEGVVGTLSKYPFSVDINGSSFTTEVTKPEFPKGQLPLSASKDYALSPSRVARDARYQSRPPGGGPVQKAGLQDGAIDKVIRRQAWEERKVVFKKQEEPDDLVDYGVMPELAVTTVQKRRTPEDVIYGEANGPQVMEVFNWFKDVGLGKNWIYQNNDTAFAESLVRFAKGEPVDFVMWNCIGFKWFADPSGDMPTCTIKDNLDAAITPFFKDRIKEMAGVLGSIGEPNLTILVPSNEALDSRVWRYQQDDDERNQVVSNAVNGLQTTFDGIDLPAGKLSVMRWDDFLRTRNAGRTAQEYSQAGETRVRESENFEKIVEEAVRSGRGYFAQNNITNIPDEVFRQRQIMYYGVYAGEGVAFEEFQQNGRDIVVVNLEEMRVPQMAFLGSKGTTPIVTPVTTAEMISYYRWEARQIQKRL